MAEHAEPMHSKNGKHDVADTKPGRVRGAAVVEVAAHIGP